MTTTIKRTEIDASIERHIAISVIVDKEYIERVKTILRLELLQAPFVRTVINWCLKYYQEFQDVPKETIQSIYTTNKEHLDETLAETIYEFLSSISEEYDRGTHNSEYVLKETEKYFKRRALLTLSADIKADVMAGKLDEAEKKQVEFVSITSPMSKSIDIFQDSVIEETFKTEERQILFKLPGALGEMIQPFCRSDFVALTAPMKRGKSFTLVDWAVRAMLAGCNVWFFSLEMVLSQMNLRFYQNIVGEVFPAEGQTGSKLVTIPVFDQDNFIYTNDIEKNYLTVEKVQKKARVLQKRGGKIKLTCETAYSMNTTEIRKKMDTERICNGFIPDIIIIDYADIMQPEYNTSKDFRHSTNHTWIMLRSLAQEYNCCVIVATQGTRGTFKKDFEQDDISEDIRKIAHVSRMIGLNKGVAAGEEDDLAKKHSHRYNVLAERHGYFDPEKFVRVLHNFEIGRSYLDSRWI